MRAQTCMVLGKSLPCRVGKHPHFTPLPTMVGLWQLLHLLTCWGGKGWASTCGLGHRLVGPWGRWARRGVWPETSFNPQRAPWTASYVVPAPKNKGCPVNWAGGRLTAPPPGRGAPGGGEGTGPRGSRFPAQSPEGTQRCRKCPLRPERKQHQEGGAPRAPKAVWTRGCHPPSWLSCPQCRRSCEVIPTGWGTPQDWRVQPLMPGDAMSVTSRELAESSRGACVAHTRLGQGPAPPAQWEPVQEPASRCVAQDRAPVSSPRTASHPPSKAAGWFRRALSAESPGRGCCGQSRKVGQGLAVPTG